jgi:ABC-type Fe3+/spermidine/putrescine transport system ATPase subunit
MDMGRLLQVGSPRELYERPANSFVRDFLGKTLLLKGAVRDGASGEITASVSGAAECLVSGQCFGADQLAAGAAVWIALRPEDAELCGSTESGALGGTIEAALFAGDRTEFQVSIPGQGSLLVYGSRRDRYEVGQQVSLRIRSDSVSLWPMQVAGSIN